MILCVITIFLFPVLSDMSPSEHKVSTSGSEQSSDDAPHFLRKRELTLFWRFYDEDTPKEGTRDYILVTLFLV